MMSSPQVTATKNAAVQVDSKCDRCLRIKFTVEVSIQTDLSVFSHTSEDFIERLGLGSVAQNAVPPSKTHHDSIVTPTQGIAFTNGIDSRSSNAACDSVPSCFTSSGSCCKYVSSDHPVEDLTISNLQEHSCPSLPEPACIFLDSFLGNVEKTKRGRKRKHRKTNVFHGKNRKRKISCDDASDVSCIGKSEGVQNNGYFNSSHSNSVQSVVDNKILVNCKNSSLVDDTDICSDGDNSDCEPLPRDCCTISKLRFKLGGKMEDAKSFKRKLACKKEGVKKNTLLKNNYLIAGLFSDDFKISKQSNKLKNKVQDVHTLSPIFPKPIHYGRYLMRQQEDFQLPYDIWISRDLKKRRSFSPAYKKIRNNIYVDVKPACKDFEPHPCNCKPPDDPEEKGCTDNCLNRMVYTECVPSLCLCGDQCDNQRIQKHQAFTGLKEFPTADRGYGVLATNPITAGQFIMEYVGEVVSEQEFRRRMTSLYSKMEHHYCLSLDGGSVIDGYRCGNVSRLINHSCSPNCEMQKWNVNGAPRIGLFALEDISVNEELTYDYNFHAYNVNAQQACKCGSENCRKVVGGRGQKFSGDVSGLEKKLRGHKSEFLMCCLKKNKKESLHVYASIYNGQPTVRERKVIGRKSILLLRNLRKVRSYAKLEDEKEEKEREDGGGSGKKEGVNKTDVFKTQFTAINTCRSVRTRQLTMAEDDDTVLRMSDLAQVFMQVFHNVVNCRDEYGNVPSNSLYHLPSKKKLPVLYEMVTNPIDLSTIERNISSGRYSTSVSFHSDFVNFFDVAQKIGSDRTSLEILKSQYYFSMETARSFLESIGDALPKDFRSPKPSTSSSSSSISSLVPVATAVETSLMAESSVLNTSEIISSPDFLSSSLPSVLPAYQGNMYFSSSSSSLSSSPLLNKNLEISPVFHFESDDDSADNDDIIRCVCGMTVDEGVMMQCDRCHTWQHQFCMRADEDEQDYSCHRCSDRLVSKEVQLTYQPKDGEHGCTYYMTLMRDETLQLRVGDAVYVVNEEEILSSLCLMLKLENLPSLESFSANHFAGVYKQLLQNVENLDIFKIENLWIDENNRRQMHGHYFLRPRETYHDAGQKFFDKEILRAPSMSSTFPVLCAVGPCCVMDINSYFLGRPKDQIERNVYVCEYKVDKNRRTVKKPLKISHHINRAKYCFKRFSQRPNIRRTYTPYSTGHGIHSARNCDSNNNRQTDKTENSSTNNDNQMNIENSRPHSLTSTAADKKSQYDNTDSESKLETSNKRTSSEFLNENIEVKRARLESILTNMSKCITQQ